MLVSCHSHKQNSGALSIVEAEYVVVGTYFAQVLWMKQQLLDYGYTFMHVPIKCDNTGTINFTKNLIQHSRTKHIEIRHRFIRNHVNIGDIVLEFVSTDK